MRKALLISSLILLSIVPVFPVQGETGTIDMGQAQPACFDSLVADIACVKLENRIFDNCIQMVPSRDYLYFMGSTIAGRSIGIYDKSGKFIRELTFPDAILLNSMSLIPETEELWVVSRFKVINRFRLDGTLVKRQSLPFTTAYAIPVGGPDFLVYNGCSSVDKYCIEGHFMALTDFKSIRKLFLPKWGRREFPFAGYSLYTKDKDGDVFLFPHNIDTIYRYDIAREELAPLYALDFHGDFLTLDKKPLTDQEMADIITNRKYIYSHYSFHWVSGKFFFKLIGKREDYCMIRQQDGALFSFDRLFDNFRSRYINPFVGSDGECLYLLVRENDLSEHYQNVKCTYPSVRKILPTLSQTGNAWILLTIKIKE